MTEANSVNESVLATLIFLSKRARDAQDSSEQQFLLVNESMSLLSYRQSAYWEPGAGVKTISGVTTLEKHAPYLQWLDRWFVGGNTSITNTPVKNVTAVTTNLTALGVSDDWREWLPPQLLSIDLKKENHYPGGRVLFARDLPFSPQEIEMLCEWCDSWRAHYIQKYKKNWRNSIAFGQRSSGLKLTARLLIIVILLGLCLLPVRLSVLAPAELIPLNPAIVRAPMDGVIDTLLVEPNERVTQGAPLLKFDSVAINSRLAVTRRSLLTAEIEYKQVAQQALFDSKSKAQLSFLQSQIKERQIEVAYLEALNSRAVVSSPRVGIAIYEEPSKWVGRPVITGERIMLIADENEAQIEAWLSPGDMIALQEKSQVRLFLTADPTRAVRGILSYLSYHPELRPDGLYAYRLRAQLSANNALPRIGLKGTVRLEGEEVPLLYWVLRRPWAALRGWVGF